MRSILTMTLTKKMTTKMTWIQMIGPEMMMTTNVDDIDFDLDDLDSNTTTGREDVNTYSFLISVIVWKTKVAVLGLICTGSSSRFDFVPESGGQSDRGDVSVQPTDVEPVVAVAVWSLIWT
jgi:hypothetical protein